MEANYEITRVNSISMDSVKIGEPYTRRQYEVILYRHDFSGYNPRIYYTVVSISQVWSITEDGSPVNMLNDKKDYDFGEYHEADSKYQHLCLKFFSRVMAERSVY